MTARNRPKNNSNEKSPASSQDDASKKSQKSTGNGVSGPATQGSRSGSWLGFILSGVFYIALIGATGFAAFYSQQIVEEIRQTNARHEESAQKNAALGIKMESVFQQVESLRSVVDGLESSLGITRVEMEGTISRMKRGEVETRRVEEALQKLQNDLLRDLSVGINEVKEARERDFSSLEKTVEERLAEVSQSIKASVAEFTETQSETQSQLADFKARLGDMENPALIKEELSAIVDTIAEIKTTKQAEDMSANSLMVQIFSVREELQTRNQEVASLSQEIQSVRTAVQDNVGSLRQSLSTVDKVVQELTDKTVTLEIGMEQAADAVHNVEKQVNAEADQALKRSDELEARVRASDDSRDSLSASVSEITSKVKSLFDKYDTHESTLAAQSQAVEEVKMDLKQELEELKSSVEESKSLTQQVGELEKRLADVEESSSSSLKPEQLESLRGVVAGLEGKAAKLEGHEQAISALQKALEETTQSLAGLSKAPGEFSDIEISENSDAEISENSDSEISENSDSEISENSDSEISENSDAEISENSDTEISENSDAEISENSDAEISENSDSEISENSDAEISENSDAEISENSDSEIIENSDAEISENSDAEISENSDSEISEN